MATTPTRLVPSPNPAQGVAAVTPSDSADLPTAPCRDLWIGTGGNVSLVAPDGTTAVFNSVPTGSWLGCGASRVNATGTTASNIVAGY